MPWCSKCKSEYRQGFTYCRYCNNPLDVYKKEKAVNLSDPVTDEKWVFLKSCTNEQEATMIESFLAAENISLLRKYGGASEYLRITCGMTILGSDLYVKKSQFDEAIEIVRDVFGANDSDRNMDIRVNSESNTWNKGAKRLFLISLLSLIFIIGSLIASFWSTIKELAQ